MCTALYFKSENSYFGRSLDLDRSYGEEVCIMPRCYPLVFRKVSALERHFAMVGMATVIGGTPLFYEAANEAGLGMAGLNFPGNAYYAPLKEGYDSIAPFEFIPWVLGQCKNISEARELLSRLNLADMAFAPQLPPSPLHWMLADRDEAIVVEAMTDGLHVYDNPVGIMTNNPPFPQHLENLKKYGHLRVDNSKISRTYPDGYSDYCQGLGAVGLPGDVSSKSRFVRGAFNLKNAVRSGEERADVGQFFHVLGSVEMVKGACVTDEGTFDITGYSACINLDRGLYYYTSYQNRRISCVDMHRADLNGAEISRFALANSEDISYLN